MRLLTFVTLSLALAGPLAPGLDAQDRGPKKSPEERAATAEQRAARQEAKREKLEAERAEKKAELAAKIERNKARRDRMEAAGKEWRPTVIRDYAEEVAEKRRERRAAAGKPEKYEKRPFKGLTREERGLPPLPEEDVKPVDVAAVLATPVEDEADEGIAAPQFLDPTAGGRTPEQVAAMRSVLAEEGKHRRRSARIARLIELADEESQPIRKRELRELQTREDERFEAALAALREDVGDVTCRRAGALADLYGKGFGRRK